MEIPLAAECKKVVNMAAEEADRLAHRHLETQHLLLGMLRLDAAGKRRNREEVEKQFETLIAPYAKKNATYNRGNPR